MKALKIALVALAVLLVIGLGVALTLYLMARHRPGYYRPPDKLPAAQLAQDLADFERARSDAEASLHRTGTVEVAVSAAQLTAAILSYSQRPDWRRHLDLPAEIRNPQVVIRPDQMIIAGEVPSQAGSVIVSVFVKLVPDEQGRPRFKVERVKVGSLTVGGERVERVIERIESFRPLIDLDEQSRLRVTEVVLEDGAVTLRGVKERR